MSFKKYASGAFALFFFCRCTYNDKDAYVDKENEGYYTKNLYTLTNYQKLADTIQLASPDEISDLRKKLEERTPKWRTTGTEPEPYELWSNFFEQEIAENIVKKLQEKHDTRLLAHYYDSLGRLFKRPSAAHEKALIAAVKALKANTVLMEAFKTRIEARYKEPEKILLMQSILDYQDFLYFILNDPSKGNRLHNKLKYYQLTLAKWQKDGYQTGKELWGQIQKEEENPLKSSKFYRYIDNQSAIKHSLSLIDQIRDNFYRLSYKDLLETLPHGINKLKEVLHELEKNERNNESANIKTLKKYLAIYPFSLQ